MTPTLVLGLGNILLRDEGVGVHVVRAMETQAAAGAALPEGVELVDGGTAGADLVDLIAHRRRVIVIDAVRVAPGSSTGQAEARPGTILRFGPESMAAKTAPGLSLHEVGLLEALLMARHLGCEPREVIVFGIIPADLGPGLDLTPPVAAAVPRVIDLVRQELAR